MERQSNLAFTERAQTLSTDVTTTALYQILLGRDPENSFVIEEAKSQTIAALMQSFFGSGEFSEFVAGPTWKGRGLRHEAMSPAPSAAQRAWIASLIVMPPSQEKAVVNAATWREFFAAFLPSAKSGYQLDGSPAEVSVGRIDRFVPTGVRGWALRLPVDSQPAEVECFIGAYWVGRGVCDEFRPEVAELFGCAGSAGFSIEFEAHMPIEQLIGLETRLFDATSKKLIDGPLSFQPTVADAATKASQVQARVASIEWQLGRLKAALQEPNPSRISDSDPKAT